MVLLFVPVKNTVDDYTYSLYTINKRHLHDE